MIRGRVIRIFDRRTVVINIGADDGVKPGMRFASYTPREDIIDPESNETLGEYRRRKATVIAQTVSKRFTVTTAAPVSRRTGGASLAGSLTSFLGQWEEIDVDLPVDSGDLQPLASPTTVTVGDTVEEIQTQRPAAAPPSAPAIPSPQSGSSSEPETRA